MTWMDFDLFDWTATKLSTRRGIVAVEDAGVWADLPARNFKIRSNLGWGGYVGFMAPEIGTNVEINPDAAFHEGIKNSFQPKLTQFRVTAQTAEAQANAVLNLKTEDESFGSFNTVQMNLTPTTSTQILDITNKNKFSKFLCLTDDNSGHKCDITKIEINVIEPNYENIFLKTFTISTNQLMRMFNPSNGLVMNLGWFSQHSEVRVPAMGGGIALAMACGNDLGVITDYWSKKIAYKGIRAFLDSPKYKGLYAHFTDNSGILSWSEYSTVDTAIGIIASLISAAYFGFDDLYNELLISVNNIDFNELRISKCISHGYQSNGNILSATWDSWGGEETLVQILQWIQNKKMPANNITRTGNVYEGVGFIIEIIGLFFRDFAISEKNDRWGLNWKARRNNLRNSHISLGTQNIFGYSAGEILIYDGGNVPSTTYNVAGSQNTNPGNGLWISPHYALMSSSVAPSASANGFEYAVQPLQVLESVKITSLNSESIDTKHVAWSSLNCFFNSLASYHSYNKLINRNDGIYSISDMIFKDILNNIFSTNKRLSR